MVINLRAISSFLNKKVERNFKSKRRVLFTSASAAFLLVFYLVSETSRSDVDSLDRLLISGATYHHEFVEPAFIPAMESDGDLAYHEAVDGNSIPAMESEHGLVNHLYRADGLLQVNPDGPHPIYELIERAEQAWNAKLDRMSKTLDQAIAEYRRRYRRPPPKGFDHWWDYVKLHDIQLPDEYDSIHDSLEHLWGVNPEELSDLQRKWEAHEASYTIGKDRHEDPISVLNSSLPHDNRMLYLEHAAQPQLDMIKDVQQFIPEFRAVFSPHDNPDQVTDYDIKAMALKAAADGTYLDLKNLPSVNLEGWGAGCPLDSPLRSDSRDASSSTDAPMEKTFIHDHKLSMDMCQNPQITQLHGQFLRYNGAPPIPDNMLAPQFSHCSTSLHNDVAVVHAYGWVEEVSSDVPWEQKVDDRLLWRGSTTGMWHAEDTPWRASHRTRLVNGTSMRHGKRMVLPPTHSNKERVGKGVDIQVGRLNAATMDVSFAADLNACEPQTCELLRRVFEIRPKQSLEAAAIYKYVLDVDGHGWSGRFKRLMTTNSVVLKSTIYPEWFTERVAPWVHYVPIKIDFSDIYDVMTFFRGNFEGEGAHEDLARKIGEGGKAWSQRFWRREDMTAYMFRLYLEYARVMSPDREAMSYIPS